jgi:glycine cleavage system H protein
MVVILLLQGVKKMETPSDLKYSKTDEWVRMDGENVVIGITDYAQEQLSDVVFIEVPHIVGDTCKKGTHCATVESVKAAAEVNFPLSGELLEVNEALSSTPELLNTEPYGKAWIVKIKVTDVSEINDLMDSAAYIKYCEGRH